MGRKPFEWEDISGDASEGMFDGHAGDWVSHHPDAPCGTADDSGCICLKLVRLDEFGGYTVDEDLSWDDYLLPYRWTDSYDEEETTSMGDWSRGDWGARGAGLNNDVFVVPINEIPGYESYVPSSCEECRELDSSYSGFRTDEEGVDDDGSVYPTHYVERGSTECRSLEWYLAWLEEHAEASSGKRSGAGHEWAYSSLFQANDWDYLTEEAAKIDSSSDLHSKGVKDSTQWRNAWFVPFYAKFFESMQLERYRMRQLVFQGWSAGESSPSNARRTIKGYTFLRSPSRNINNWTTSVEGGGSSSWPRWWDNKTCAFLSGYTDTRVSEKDVTDLIDPNISSFDNYMKAENYAAHPTFPRKAQSKTLEKWQGVFEGYSRPKLGNGTYMAITRTTFKDTENFGSDDPDRYHRVSWPISYYGGDTPPSGLAKNVINPSDEGTFPHADGHSSGNPYITARDTVGEISHLQVLYNPNERKGLVQRFGPYHYLPENQEWDVSFPGYVAGFGRNKEWDRRAWRQMYNWYDYYTLKMIESWNYDEQYTEGMERRASDYTFRKVKALRYSPEKIYSMSDEDNIVSVGSSGATSAMTDKDPTSGGY